MMMMVDEQVDDGGWGRSSSVDGVPAGGKE